MSEIKITPEMVETGAHELMEKYPELDIEDAKRQAAIAMFKIWPHFSDETGA